MKIIATISSASYFKKDINGAFEVAAKEPKDSDCRRDHYLRLIHPDTAKEFGVHVFEKDVTYTNEAGQIINLPYGRIGATNSNGAVLTAPEVVLTEEELDHQIYRRFAVMDTLSDALIGGISRSLIISGSAGIGKTYSLETKLKRAEESGTIDSYKHIKGRLSPLQLYIQLWENRAPGQVLLLDDVNVWNDESSVDILKAALDSSDVREVSWMSTLKYLEENEIPNQFEYEGTIVFISNINFDKEIGKSNGMAPHLRALISRSNYLDLKVHTNQEILVRIKQIIRDSRILENNGLTSKQGVELVQWLQDNVDTLREVSLRTVIKIAQYMAAAPNEWEEMSAIMLKRAN